MYAAPSGVLTILPRWALFNIAASLALGDTTDGSQVPYEMGQAYDYDNTYLYNVISVTRNDGPTTSITATTKNLASQLAYFTRSALQQTISTTSDLDAYTLADWESGTYAQPQMRVRQLAVDAGSKPGLTFPDILIATVSTVATVDRNPVGGSPISGNYLIQKVSHAIGPTKWVTALPAEPVCGAVGGPDPGRQRGERPRHQHAVLAGGLMPLPVTSWTADTPITAKSLNLALYTIDGTLNKPQGILLHAQRPMSFEVIGAAGALLLFTSAPTGHRNIISQSGDTEPAVTILDSAGYYGQSTDGVYWFSGYVFTPAVIGTNGDGSTPGGWTIVCHFMPIQTGVSTTTDGIGADLDESGTVVCSGARQKINYQNSGCAFFLDLQNSTGKTFQPSVNDRGLDVHCGDPALQRHRFLRADPPVLDRVGRDQRLRPVPRLRPARPPRPVCGALHLGYDNRHDRLRRRGRERRQRDRRAGELPVQPAAVPGEPDRPARRSATTRRPAVSLGSSADVDNYCGWTASTYTIQRAGLYLTHGIVPFTANSTGTRRCGIQVNGGTTYWGPGYAAIIAGETIASKTQIFSFQAGDTIQLMCEQNSGGSLALATGDECRMFVAWLGLEGTPSTLWTPPDTSFRWQAGTAGTDLPDLFQAHLANDLGFLCNRPYLMAYQTGAQTGFADGSWNTVVLDTVAGIIHSDTGDNYSGLDVGVQQRLRGGRRRLVSRGRASSSAPTRP